MYDPRLVLLKSSVEKAHLLHVVSSGNWAVKAASLPPEQLCWAQQQGFSGEASGFVIMPEHDGTISAVYAGVKPDDDGYGLARLAMLLPRGIYQLVADSEQPVPFAELAWMLEAYAFEGYKPRRGSPAQLLCRASQDYDELVSIAQSCCLVRDLINMPANALGPDELEQAALDLGQRFNMRAEVVRGAQLTTEFPMVQAVGQGSDRAPRLVDLRWGNVTSPKVTLVGKGVIFDSGGLDIKPASGMALMKKDMGGAAHVLGLAQMVMAAGLNIALRVLIPIVENSISGSAFRPGDVLTSRKGLTVEIGNTDAEGRLILADALALADEESPDLLIDMATLTGAARVALGPDLPPFFTDDEDVADELMHHSKTARDPLWRLPLWRRYDQLFESSIADLNNAGEGGFAGAITAALFLRRFVERAHAYVHFDVYGWTPAARAAAPKGGEAQGIRALYSLLKARYGN